MPKANIFFELATDLIKATAWVYDPDTKLAAHSAYRHIYMKQLDANTCGFIGYAQRETWLFRKCRAQGIIGTEFLYDAHDLLRRLGKEDSCKNFALEVAETKNNAVNIRPIQKMEGNKFKSIGNNLYATYAGDLADFVMPDQVDWIHLTSIDASQYSTIVSTINSFSSLKGDKNERSVYFRFEKGLLSVLSTERDNRPLGLSMVCCEMPVYAEDTRFGVLGMYFYKTAEVFGMDTGVVSIEVDDLEEPTCVKFEGDNGWIILKTVSRYNCRALAVGGMKFFYDEDCDMVTSCDRTFILDELTVAVALNKPRVGYTVDDLILGMINHELTISKVSDSKKAETAKISTFTLDGKGDWVTLLPSHAYFTIMLDTLDSYLNSKTKRSTREKQNSDITNGEQLEFTPMPDTKTITLSQKYLMVGDDMVWRLYVESYQCPELRMFVSCQTLNMTSDRADSD